MHTLSLVIVEVICVQVPEPTAESLLARRLLLLANTWMRRRAAGAKDSLLLIGVDAGPHEAFKLALAKYGLVGVVTEVVEAEAGDSLDVGDAVGDVIDAWLSKCHPSVIPLSGLPSSMKDLGYSDEAWWLGLTCDAEHAPDWAESIAALTPAPYSAQAATWAAIWAMAAGLERENDDRALFEQAMEAAALAFWLTGFGAASGNMFFDFDYSKVSDVCSLDPLLLGYESAKDHADEIDDEWGGSSVEDLATVAARVLLKSGRFDGAQVAVCRFLGGDAAVFFTLYCSIWPRRSVPAGEACVGLIGLEHADYPELEASWRFVADGDWSSVDDSE